MRERARESEREMRSQFLVLQSVCLSDLFSVADANNRHRSGDSVPTSATHVKQLGFLFSAGCHGNGRALRCSKTLSKDAQIRREREREKKKRDGNRGKTN